MGYGISEIREREGEREREETMKMEIGHSPCTQVLGFFQRKKKGGKGR